MHTVAIACLTLKDEIEHLLTQIDFEGQVDYIKPGLHKEPQKLSQLIQEKINLYDGKTEFILLAFGSCNNALQGLQAQKSYLVHINAEDCISILLGGNIQRAKISAIDKAVYMTSGWLNYNHDLENIYNELKKSSDEETALQIYQQMFSNYKNVDLIDTGSYSREESLKKSEALAKKLALRHRVIPGTLLILKKLFTEEWDDNFSIIEPGLAIDLAHRSAVTIKSGNAPALEMSKIKNTKEAHFIKKTAEDQK